MKYSMNYSETIEYIHSTPKFSRVLGNDLLCRLLDKSGNPQSNLRFIHIAGTNGKGSAAAMLSQILSTAGYKTGLYTSPYITRYNERMKICGVDISDDELASITSEIRTVIETYDTPVSEFALGTAVAFKYFQQNNCDIVILETGLGGRLDATNVIKSPIMSILMSIGLDHTQYLGDTIEKITTEKCGIIKNNCPCVVYPKLQSEVLEIIQKNCYDKNSPLYIADLPDLMRGKNFGYQNKTYSLSLDGEFQKYNAATVLKSVEVLKQKGFDIPQKAIDDGLKTAANPARLEKLKCGLILDGAHNPPAVEALTKTLLKKKRPVFLCVAMMLDKDIKNSIQALAKIKPKLVIATTVTNMPRCADPKLIAKEFKALGISAKVCKNPINASKKLLEESKDTKNAFPLVCGSLYLAGEVRREFADYDNTLNKSRNSKSKATSDANSCDKSKIYYVYILRCCDNSLYTGYTTDIVRRYTEHCSDDLLKRKGAKYTKSHKPENIAAVWTTYNMSTALRFEAFIKRMNKSDKELLIKKPTDIPQKYTEKNPNNDLSFLDVSDLNIY